MILKGADLPAKELDTLLLLLGEKKRKLEEEESESNMEILLEFLHRSRQRKQEELHEVRIHHSHGVMVLPLSLLCSSTLYLNYVDIPLKGLFSSMAFVYMRITIILHLAFMFQVVHCNMYISLCNADVNSSVCLVSCTVILHGLN